MLPPHVDALPSGRRVEERISRPGDRHRDDDRALLSRPAEHAGIDRRSAIYRHDPAIEIGRGVWMTDDEQMPAVVGPGGKRDIDEARRHHTFVAGC